MELSLLCFWYCILFAGSFAAVCGLLFKFMERFE